MSILESARLAFVAVDGHQPWPWLTPDKLPFHRAGESCSAQPSQARGFELGDDLIGCDRAITEIL